MSPTKSTAPRGKSKENGPLTYVLGALVILAGLWALSARKATRWLLEHGYFTTDDPVAAIPGSVPPGAGPTLLAALSVMALTMASVGTAISLRPLLVAPSKDDPDARRPLPSVTAPLIGLCGSAFAAVALLLIPIFSSLIAGAAAGITTFALGDWAYSRLQLRHNKARIIHEIEWGLLPYLGFKELPKTCLVKVLQWSEPEDPTEDILCPKQLDLTYKGRREELKPELSKRLDEAIGAGHYSLQYATTDQKIRATATTTEPEPQEVVKLREIVSAPELFGEGATICSDERHPLKYNPEEQVVEFTVKHNIALKLAASNKPAVIERKLSEVLAGRWRAKEWNTPEGLATFEIRPELPTLVFPPVIPEVTSVAEACEKYPKAEIPIAIDENQEWFTWHLPVNPHHLKVGPTGTGKTAAIHTIIAMAARMGLRIFIIDFKGGEFTNYRLYPNVVTVVTEPYEAVALVQTLYREMMSRYQLYKRDRKSLRNKEPFLIVFDEYTEFSTVISEFYANTKDKNARGECPTLKQFSSLLRLARSCKLHCLAATQRPDQTFLKGEAKLNFTNRLSLGRLDQVSAAMIHDNPYAGRTIPLGVRGRGTALHRKSGKHIEVQTFYTPDPLEPANDEERQILEELKPSVTLYERGIIKPPETDPATHPKDFSYYQALPLLKVAEHPEFDPASDKYNPPEWQLARDAGVDSIFGTLTGSTPQTADELIDAWKDEMSAPEAKNVDDLEYGDYIQDPTSGLWGFVDDQELLVDPDNPDTYSILLRLDSGDRTEIEIPTTGTVQMRQIKELVAAGEGRS
ncbi:FtsK/SpoIIIE domain-containing protein [Mycobacteroides abscessus]